MGASIKKTNSIFFNHSFDKKRLKRLIFWVFKKSGEAEALKVLDLLKKTGFQYATKAGISIGLHDLTTPLQKSWLISESQLAMNTTDRDFIGAKITATERSQRIIDTWHRASESLSKQVVDYFGIYDQFNPVYIMALSGARGNFSQVRQLIGMRGLMADQQGKIVNFPIRSNLREGLTLTEYFISCSGARKGLVDTALRTADTGYLTRRLVDVSHHVVVKRIRCNTNRGIAFKSLQSYNKVLLDLKERLVGRVLAENIETPFYESEPQEMSACLQEKKKNNNLQITYTNKNYERCQQSITRTNGNLKLIAKKDQEISSKLSLKISQVRDRVFIRSPLTCEFTHSVCQLCYGWSISQGSLVSLGDAVGVIAAQSIGEPGTQLTMRTFHTGGVFSGDLLQEIRAPHGGEIRFSKAFQGLLIRSAHGRIAFLSKTQGSLVLRNNHHFQISTKSSRATVKKSHNSTEIPIQAFTMLFVRQGEKVEKNQLLAEFSIQKKEGNQPIKTQQTIFADVSGRVVEDSSGTVYTKSIKESVFLLQPSFLGYFATCPNASSCTPYKNNTNQKRLSNLKKSCCFEHLLLGGTKIKQNINKKNRILQQSVRERFYHLPKTIVSYRIKKNICRFYFCNTLWRPKRVWQDKLPFLTIATKGVRQFAKKVNFLRNKALPVSLQNKFRKRVQISYGYIENTARQDGKISSLELRYGNSAKNKFFAKPYKYKFSNCLAAHAPTYPYLPPLAPTCPYGARHGTALCPVGALHGTAQHCTAQRDKREHICRGKLQHGNYRARHMPFEVPEESQQGKALVAKPPNTRTLPIVDWHEPMPLLAVPCCAVSCPEGSRRVKKGQEGSRRVKKGRGKGKENGATRACLLKESIKAKKKETTKTSLKTFFNCITNKACTMNKISSSFKREDLENDVFKYIEPVRSGRLGFLKILSTRVGATLDYTCPIKPFDHNFIKRKKMQKVNVCRTSYVFARRGTEIGGKDYFSKKNKMQSKIARVSTHYKVRPEVGEVSDAKTEMYEMSQKNKIERKNNQLCFLKNQLHYLHPEYQKENRFFLQSIAEYGDIVDEAYKII